MNSLKQSFFFVGSQDAIQAQMVIQKMSEMGINDSSEADATLGSIAENQPLYANMTEEDSSNANVMSSSDRENNVSVPVSLPLNGTLDIGRLRN